MFPKTFAILAAATATLLAPSIASAASCPELPSIKAFAGYGDNADYSLAPNGSFEGGTGGWTLSNAKVVNGNGGLLGIVDTLLGGSKSLSIGSGLLPGVSTVTTPEFCVDATHPYFRYMLKANGAVGVLTTYIQYKASDGSTQLSEVKSLASPTLLPGKWKPSALNPLAINIPLVSGGGTTAKVRLVFKSTISVLGSGYQIDNVLIDPYRRN